VIASTGRRGNPSEGIRQQGEVLLLLNACAPDVLSIRRAR
jgi:hypothetical protein